MPRRMLTNTHTHKDKDTHKQSPANGLCPLVLFPLHVILFFFLWMGGRVAIFFSFPILLQTLQRLAMTTPSAVDGEERGQEDDDGTRSPEPSPFPEQDFNQPIVVLPTSPSSSLPPSSFGNPHHHHHMHLNKSKQSPSVMVIPEMQGSRSSAVDSEMHLLPSQLRKRHETARGLHQQPLQEQLCPKDTLDFIDPSLDATNTKDGGSVFEAISEDLSDQDDRSSHLLDTATFAENPQGGKITFDDHDSSNEDADPLQMTSPETVAASSFQLAKGEGGALIRANSYSLFESISNKNRGMQSDQSHNWSSSSSAHSALSQVSQPPKGLQLAAGDSLVEERWSSDLAEMVMPTRDWIKMQTRINSLEQEVQHVTRTNILLNQELDKLNNHLLRLTSEEGAGWRKEYEFLVQQVDLMHRQLQLAYSQGHGQGQAQGQRQGAGGSAVSSLSKLNSVEGQQRQPKMTSQLHAEVKDLTASLRNWQAAFQQAEEKYRKKCGMCMRSFLSFFVLIGSRLTKTSFDMIDGERSLKQTLQERDTQLSALAAKLSGYEVEFQKSISNYEQLVRLSTELEVLEGKKRRGSITVDSTTTNGSNSHGTIRNRLSSIAEKDVQATASLRNDGGEHRSDVIAHQLQGHMPGVYPGGEQRLVLAPNVDKLTVSIMSWVALLVTYMLS